MPRSYCLELLVRKGRVRNAAPGVRYAQGVSDPAKLCVLVAEDQPRFRAAILNLLRPLGVTCVVVENGALAAEVLADTSQEVHLLITDMRMPGGSGWRAIEAAREHRGRSLPIIMQTGESQYSDVILRAKVLGVPVVAKADLLTSLVPAVREALGI